MYKSPKCIILIDKIKENKIGISYFYIVIKDINKNVCWKLEPAQLEWGVTFRDIDGQDLSIITIIKMCVFVFTILILLIYIYVCMYSPYNFKFMDNTLTSIDIYIPPYHEFLFSC